MKFLLDEMLPPATCGELGDLGHEALSVRDTGLAGTDDRRVLDVAVSEGRVMVTENLADFALLLEQRLAAAEPCIPARANPEPYIGPHWA
jgi:predicted nuclease of predicted toxin-antitoxin system